jgi:hypothetical protein
MYARKVQEYHEMRVKYTEFSRRIALETHDREWNEYRGKMGCKAIYENRVEKQQEAKY